MYSTSTKKRRASQSHHYRDWLHRVHRDDFPQARRKRLTRRRREGLRSKKRSSVDGLHRRRQHDEQRLRQARRRPQRTISLPTRSKGHTEDVQVPLIPAGTRAPRPPHHSRRHASTPQTPSTPSSTGLDQPHGTHCPDSSASPPTAGGTSSRRNT